MMDITSFFANPSIWGVGLSVLFGAIWLASLKPLHLRRPGPWLVLIAGSALFAPSIAWIQVPLQTLVGDALIRRLGILTYQNQIYFTGIPVVLLSGLIQEGAKLLPVSVHWWSHQRKLTPRFALTLGAMAGVGFGIFESQWVLNSLFASGWSLSSFQIYGFLAIAGFWERFFTIAFHTASTALAGWGLSRGYGWQFYLLASFLHFLLNYSVIFFQKGVISTLQVEISVAGIAVVLFAVVLWLRYRKENNIAASTSMT
jgi:RsiW-degrading membrane proteinase PrsW (M82 family)